MQFACLSSSPDNVFLVATGSIPPETLENRTKVLNYIWKGEHKVHSAVSVDAGSFYNFGFSAAWEVNWSAEEGDVTRVAVIRRCSAANKVLLSVRFESGIYILQLSRKGRQHKRIRFFVRPRRHSFTIPLGIMDRAVNCCILYPCSSFWMLQQLNSLLIEQQFYLIAVHNGKHIYNRSLTMNWTISILPYGNSSHDQFLSEVACANEVLVLMERNNHFEQVYALDRIANLIDFTVKTESTQRGSVTFDSLSEAEARTMSQLRRICFGTTITISAAQVGRSERSCTSFSRLVIEWIALPYSFKNQPVFLRCTYAARNELLDESHVTQLTKEIVAGNHTVYGTTSDSNQSVFLSCCALTFWALAASIDEVAKKYLALQAVEQVCISDIAPLACYNNSLADMSEKMQAERTPEIDTQLRWKWVAEKAITQTPSLLHLHPEDKAQL